MKKNIITILGIETSCDETAAAVVQMKINKLKNHPKTPYPKTLNPNPYALSNVVSSQIKLHQKYGGVYPELASRAHLENILPVIELALKKAFPASNLCLRSLSCIDAIAVTTGPGLVGSLLIGTETARTLSYIFNKPIIGINHLEGHICSAFSGEIQNSKSQFPNKFQIPKNDKIFPAICLIVSGGHTSLVLIQNFGKYKVIGETRDDAAGEAFDKVAALLGLSYPGGPAIEAAASKIHPKTLNPTPYTLSLPRPMIGSINFDFSFSGLKTAVLQLTKNLGSVKTKKLTPQIAAEFQNAVAEVLISKTFKAAKKFKAKTIMISGGVAANSFLRKEFKFEIRSTCPQCLLAKHGRRAKSETSLLIPPKNLCTDNAAMIAAAGAFKFSQNKINKWQKIQANPNLKLT